MEAPPKPTPIVGGVPRPERRQHSRWSFEFHRLRVHDVRSIVLDDSDFTGNLHGELGFAVRSASGEAEIYASEIEVVRIPKVDASSAARASNFSATTRSRTAWPAGIAASC